MKFFPVLLLLFITDRVTALGIGEWSSYTPGGNIIGHDRLTNVMSFSLLMDGQSIDSLDGWYFYKNFVVGTFNHSSRYFIVDESRSQITTFSKKEEWSEYLRINQLNPTKWTRWYYDDWDYNLHDLPGYLIFQFILSLLIAGLCSLLWFGYKTYKNQDFRWLKFYLFTTGIATTIIWGATFIDVFLSKHPQSM